MMKTNRRTFLKGTAGFAAAAGGGCCGAGKIAKKPRGAKIRLAPVGVMGKGFSDWLPMVQCGKAEVVAFCDADRGMRESVARAIGNLRKSGKLNHDFDPMKVPFYSDYRRMLDDAAKLGIEAITVSTSDHMHAPIAIRAMKMGIHCYVQKPLVRTLWEAKYFGEVAKESGVVTQMGNQGSGTDGFRRNVEIVQSGILGDVREVHVWTNRPVWPQGYGAANAAKGAADPVPANLDWDAWLGTAKERPFKGAYPQGAKVHDPWKMCKNVYHPFSWRGFCDFGCGAFGDMACHTMNVPYRGLELGAAIKAECLMAEEKNDATFPLKSTVVLTYPERKSKLRPGVTLPEVKLYWYDGAQLPSADLLPQVVAATGGVPERGCLLVGSNGIFCSNKDDGQDAFFALKGEKAAQNTKDHPACVAVKRSLPYRSGPKPIEEHYIEFLDAINGNGPVFRETNSRCYSDVDYAVPMMEGILAGCVAQQVEGELRWCTEEARFIGNERANELVRPYVRRGFEF